MNKLTTSTSPYLRQHAKNPVNWFPWTDETLALARQQNKPIFLSIGYSTCHWCHVMAHESFENAKVAEIMNQHFLNIKVDREERPDVDAIYMTAVQALTGSGGWPMSVWLTPDLKPFFAGTYFPPEDRYGRPGFSGILTQIAEMWAKEPQRILESGEQITGFLKQYGEQANTKKKDDLNGKELAEKVFSFIKNQFDPLNGGFSPAPKFPMPVYMEFLLNYYDRTKNAEALQMTAFTMEKISQGGITDHLGGGFSRYSTDERWVVPHFEKMLYDNAQLISVAAGLFDRTQDQRWKTLTEQALAYALRDLRDAGGGFYSAEDADSEGKEGTFYLWTVHEVKKHLSAEQADIFIRHYGLIVDGNFVDPHTRESGKNILVKKEPITDPKDQKLLGESEKILLSVRNQRPRPHRDEKILTEWNGLMISALIRAATALKEPRYAKEAAATAAFLKANLYDVGSNQLYRSFFDGGRTVLAQQSDYAMLIQALLDLHQYNKEQEWRDWAVKLAETHEKQFFDEELGGYFMNVARPDLLIRIKDDTDNVIPSGNSIAVRNGLRLGLRDHADKTIRAFSYRLSSYPASMALLVAAIVDCV